MGQRTHRYKMNTISAKKSDELRAKYAAILLMKASVLEQQNDTDAGMEPQDGGTVGLNSKRIPKNGVKKPPEFGDL